MRNDREPWAGRGIREGGNVERRTMERACTEETNGERSGETNREANGKMNLALFLLLEGRTNLYACTGCSICSSVCPASRAGEMDPCSFVRLAILGRDEMVLNNQWIWSCAQCLKCSSACPEGIDIHEAINSAKALQPEGSIPGPLSLAMKAEAVSGNSLGTMPARFMGLVSLAEEAYERRFGTRVSFPVDRQGAETLLLPSHLLMEKEPELLASYARIFEAAGESWTLSSLCLDSACSAWFARNGCGQDLWTTRLCHIMESLGAKVCIMDDCASPLAPFGAGARVREEEKEPARISIVSMTEQIFNYLEQGRIALRSMALEGPVTIQDPCNTSKSQELIEFPRTLVEFMEAELTEMVLARTESVCCGGVLLSCAMKEEAERFGSWKLRHLEESRAKKVLTVCASCYRQISRLLARSGHDMEVLFLPQLVAERVTGGG